MGHQHLSETRSEVEEFLRASNLTAAELARRVGVGKATISQLFRGSGTATWPEMLDRMGHELGFRIIVKATDRLPPLPDLTFKQARLVARVSNLLRTRKEPEVYELLRSTVEALEGLTSAVPEPGGEETTTDEEPPEPTRPAAPM